MRNINTITFKCRKYNNEASTHTQIEIQGKRPCGIGVYHL